MYRTTIACLTLSSFALTACAATADDTDTASIEFFVSVPAGTPTDATLYIAGNLDAVGQWRAKGAPLARRDDGRYYAKLTLPRGALMEYKITRGAWETVEKTAQGAEIANRQLLVKGDTKVDIKVEAWASGEGGGKGGSVIGDIRYHHAFESKHLGNKRTLIVYLPPDYKKDAERRYPVLYMHDGQNIFDAKTSFLGIEWQADDHAERLIKAGRIEPIIIVGMYNNADRTIEYTPQRDESRRTGGKGDLYARFVVEEVKPFIDKTYRTRPDRANTGVAGSSLGGLISLHICRKYPDVFSRCGAISPALMWADHEIIKSAKKDASWMKGLKIWLDMGTNEGKQIDSFNRAIEDTRAFVDVMDAAGMIPGRDYYYAEVYNGEHNEAFWAQRFDKILLYLYGK